MDNKVFIDALKTYKSISDMLKSHTYEEILQQTSSLLNISPQQLELCPMGGYSKGKTSGAYRFVLKDLLQNISHYDWLYEKLADEKSKIVFHNQILYRLLPHNQFLRNSVDPNVHQYFEKEFVNCTEDEVFVDCGGFIGDTTEDYISQYGVYKKIYVYEPSEDNIATCKNNLKKYDNIIFRACGVGETSTHLSISNSQSSSTFMGQHDESDGEKISIISLDDDIKEPVTFIKMDIEGFEIPAILGAKYHIKNENPKLAICTYHIVSDLWEIPRLIDAIYPYYKFYLRHYNPDQNWETVLYAIPDQTKQNVETKSSRLKTVLALTHKRGWDNAEFVKDRLCVPYLFHKNYGSIVKIIGERVDNNYSNIQYTPGVSVEFVDCWDIKDRHKYIVTHAKDIDLITMPECQYTIHDSVIALYKQLNPKGKVYLALDANSGWMDRIQLNDPAFVRFMNNCDVIGASCRAMQRHLNQKWPWKIEYFPNAFYDYTHTYSPPLFQDKEDKENVILTVGRLGSTQKATDVLLKAFALIACEVPDWKLKLVGSIEQEFQSWVEEFMSEHPYLKERIEFTGAILDRTELYKQYKQAKIFAMTSRWEGGTPNVTAEALVHGCVTCFTKIDAYDDAIDGGRCGLAAEIDDAEGFAHQLLALCKSDKLEEMSAHAYKIGTSIFDMEKNIDRLYYMLFGGKN